MKSKRFTSAFAFAATLLTLLAVLMVCTNAEESSILEGATIIADSPGDFADYLPDLDLFFGVGFKSVLQTDPSDGYRGDGSKEVKI